MSFAESSLRIARALALFAMVFVTLPVTAGPELEDRRQRRCDRLGALLEAAESGQPAGRGSAFQARAIANLPERIIARQARRLTDRCVRLNEVQVLGTHNSYHIEPSAELIDRYVLIEPAAIFWEYTHLPLAEQFASQGIRQIELDVFADPEGGLYDLRRGLELIGEDPQAMIPELLAPGFKVLHVQHLDFDTTCLTLVDCLSALRDWSRSNPDHLPLAILIEAKDANFDGLPLTVPFDAALFDELDAEIRSVFSEQEMITPDDVRRNYATLEGAVLERGWPLLGRSRGQVLFLMDNGGSKRDLYRAGRSSLEGRVLFTNGTPGDADAAFVKANDPLGDPALIPDLVEAGYLVRTRADGDTEEARSGETVQRDAAVASGAHFVSTDYPVADPRFDSGYRVEIPDAPGRCNPVNAPAYCRSALLEP